MAPDDRKRSYRRDMLFAAVMVAAGVAMSGISAAQLLTTRHQQMAQATQPLQSTPGADSKPSAPAEPATTGKRPGEPAPEPARPDAEAQKAGATPALPPAPAEKTAAPIKER
jgi:cytoskeletal protein RodZ